MNLLSKTAYNFSDALKALQVKKNFLYSLAASAFLSAFLHIVENSYLKIANSVFIIFLVTIWVVKWEGKTNREVFYIAMTCIGVTALLLIIRL